MIRECNVEARMCERCGEGGHLKDKFVVTVKLKGRRAITRFCPLSVQSTSECWSERKRESVMISVGPQNSAVELSAFVRDYE